MLLGGDGGVGENWNAERLSGADGGVTGDTWTWISPSQTGWFWHGDASVGDLPSDEADGLVSVSVVVDTAESPVRIARTSSPWSMLRRRSNATFQISIILDHRIACPLHHENWTRLDSPIRLRSALRSPFFGPLAKRLLLTSQKMPASTQVPQCGRCLSPVFVGFSPSASMARRAVALGLTSQLALPALLACRARQLP